MSAGFQWAGSLSGAAPVVRKLLASCDLYQGQLVQDPFTTGTGGHVDVADAASDTNDDDQGLLGIVTGVVDGSRAYDTTYYGDKSTYTTTQATVLANGPAEVEVTLIIPNDTLIKGPIFNAAYGTALTEAVCTTANAGGTVLYHASDAVTDIADDFATLYCRSGANRGVSRIITTSDSTVQQTVTIPFPKGIVAGDVFVICSCVLGYGGLDIPATANCIDGNNDMNAYYRVYYHEINLETSGKEYAVFSITGAAADHTRA